LVDRPQPLLQGSSTVDVSDNTGSKSHGKRGVFSEFLTNPDENEDYDFLVPGQTPPIPPLEGLLGSAIISGTQKIGTFRRSGYKRTADNSASAMRAQLDNVATAAVDPSEINGSEFSRLQKQGHSAGVKQHLDQVAQDQLLGQIVKKQKVDYRKALEPKVMLPYESTPGQTPRKIEIERRKRLFAAQKIEDLIAKETVTVFSESNMPEIAKAEGGEVTVSSVDFEDEFAKRLPLSFFDDTEYEQRTLQEWLDMRVDHSGSAQKIDSSKTTTTSKKSSAPVNEAPKIMEATVPIPAKALFITLKRTQDLMEMSSENIAETEKIESNWKDCIATAYDTKEQKWKIRWIKFSGWDLDGNHDEEEGALLHDADVDDSRKEDEDESSSTLPEGFESKSPEEKLLYCGKNEQWVDRFVY
jgi:hypothetical protein